MKKVSWKEIGLVNPAECSRSHGGEICHPRYNFNNMEQLQAIVNGLRGVEVPVHPAGSSGARSTRTRPLAFPCHGRVAMIKDAKSPVKFALHLDHGDTFELCKSCIDSGFSSS